MARPPAPPPTPRLYGELADWWHLLSAPEDYATESERIRDLVRETATGPVATLLELGSGGGNTASHLGRWFALTLVDLSPGMLAVSRRVNGSAIHVVGDMRTVRLGVPFDAVLIHDAVSYMTTAEDLRAALVTARAHLRPGGAAVFLPDHVRETFASGTGFGGRDGDGRSLRYLDWTHDPDPDDTTYETAYAYLLREGDRPPRVEQDRHVLGLFPTEEWLSLLRDAGFADPVHRQDPTGSPEWPLREVFLARA